MEEIPGCTGLVRIGHGGFSTVYRARQPGLDRDVAVKVLALDGSDPEARRRFERECRLTGRLSGHPNIVTVLDSGVAASGRPYLLLEWYPAGSLRQRLDAGGPLTVPEVLRLGVKLAGALGAAHRAGVLHLDVKPQNVLLTAFGEPALADFGVARMLDATATSVGFTPQHAAPELFGDTAPGVAADVYSLASTLYHALTGQPAFRPRPGEPLAGLVGRVLREEPPPVTRPDAPAGLVAALARGMAKEPAARFAEVEDLGRALQRVQADLGITVEELPGPDDDGRTVTRAGSTGPARPRWWRFALPAAGAAALAAVAVLTLRPAPAPERRAVPPRPPIEAPATVGTCAFFHGTAPVPPGSTLVLVKRNLDNGDPKGYVEFVRDVEHPVRPDGSWLGHQFFVGAAGQHVRVELRAVTLRQALEADRAGDPDPLATVGEAIAAVTVRPTDAPGPDGGGCDYR